MEENLVTSPTVTVMDDRGSDSSVQNSSHDHNTPSESKSTSHVQDATDDCDSWGTVDVTSSFSQPPLLRSTPSLWIPATTTTTTPSIVINSQNEPPRTTAPVLLVASVESVHSSSLPSPTTLSDPFLLHSRLRDSPTGDWYNPSSSPTLSPGVPGVAVATSSRNPRGQKVLIGYLRSPLCVTGFILGMAIMAMTIGIALFCVSGVIGSQNDASSQILTNPQISSDDMVDYWIQLHDFLWVQQYWNHANPQPHDPHQKTNQSGSVSNDEDEKVVDHDAAVNEARQRGKVPPLKPGSPQWKALQWLVSHDPMGPWSESLKPTTLTMGETNDSRPNQWTTEKLIQRYALAVLYYSWNGPTMWNFPAAVNITSVTTSNATAWFRTTVTVNGRSPEIQGNTTRSSLLPRTTSSSPALESIDDECSWLGVTCNSHGRITQLDLRPSPFVLLGEIPTELALLTDLQELHLAGKGLKGRLPEALYRSLTSLTHINLRENYLSILHPDLRYWSKLRFIDWSQNRLKGTIPVEAMAKWKDLTHLTLRDNPDLEGNFWQDYLPHWPQLQDIDISNTALSGTLPEFTPGGPFTELRSIQASATPLTGTLPSTLAELSYLRVLELDDLRGTLRSRIFPTELARLTTLTRLSLRSSNALEGTLPTLLGQLTLLRELDLHYLLAITGTIPTEVGLLTNLLTLHLQHTRLSGTIPTELGQCTRLTDVQLHQSQLVGTMPDEICRLRIKTLIADCSGAIGTPKVQCDFTCCSECFYSF